MVDILFYVGIGVVLGWFFLPTPEFMRVWIAKIPYLGAYMR